MVDGSWSAGGEGQRGASRMGGERRAAAVVAAELRAQPRAERRRGLIAHPVPAQPSRSLAEGAWQTQMLGVNAFGAAAALAVVVCRLRLMGASKMDQARM